MPTADTRDRLAEELSGPIGDLGLDLEAVDLSSAGKRRVLRVAIDKDGGVTMDDIADATTEISRVLDDTNLMGEQPFTLEVSSPGVERPLTLPRHWRRNTGRLVTVTLGEGDPLTGRITVTDDDGALLEIEGAERRVEYAEVRKAKIQIEFKKEST
ncbi:MAG: rimP [Marmoricola sp.]|nr:rimP [Marmoricola sp.]